MKPQETQTRINGAQTYDVPVKPERTGPSKWAIMAIVAVGGLMATLDSSIVNISLPSIATDFGVPLNGAVEWVVIAYLVATASFLLTAGRLADMIGNKTVWLAGLVVFTGGSALCGAAPSLTFLIVARALQGLGGALLMSISPALLTSAFPAHERGRALAGYRDGGPDGGAFFWSGARLVFTTYHRDAHRWHSGSDRSVLYRDARPQSGHCPEPALELPGPFRRELYDAFLPGTATPLPDYSSWTPAHSGSHYACHRGSHQRISGRPLGLALAGGWRPDDRLRRTGLH